MTKNNQCKNLIDSSKVFIFWFLNTGWDSVQDQGCQLKNKKKLNL